MFEIYYNFRNKVGVFVIKFMINILQYFGKESLKCRVGFNHSLEKMYNYIYPE